MEGNTSIDSSLFDLSFFEGSEDNGNNAVWTETVDAALDENESGSVGSSSTSGDETLDDYNLLNFMVSDTNRHAPSPLKIVQTIPPTSPRRQTPAKSQVSNGTSYVRTRAVAR